MMVKPKTSGARMLIRNIDKAPYNLDSRRGATDMD